MILVFSSLQIIVVYEFRSQLVLCSIVSRLKPFEQVIKNAKVSAASYLSKKNLIWKPLLNSVRPLITVDLYNFAVLMCEVVRMFTLKLKMKVSDQPLFDEVSALIKTLTRFFNSLPFETAN